MHQTSRVRNHGVPCDVPEGYRATRPGAHHDPGRLVSNTSSTTDAYDNVYDGNWTYWFTADSFRSPHEQRKAWYQKPPAHTSSIAKEANPPALVLSAPHPSLSSRGPVGCYNRFSSKGSSKGSSRGSFSPRNFSWQKSPHLDVVTFPLQ